MSSVERRSSELGGTERAWDLEDLKNNTNATLPKVGLCVFLVSKWTCPSTAGRCQKSQKINKSLKMFKMSRSGPPKFLKIMILTSQKLENLLQNCSFFAFLLSALLDKLPSCRVR